VNDQCAPHQGLETSLSRTIGKWAPDIDNVSHAGQGVRGRPARLSRASFDTGGLAWLVRKAGRLWLCTGSGVPHVPLRHLVSRMRLTYVTPASCRASLHIVAAPQTTLLVVECCDTTAALLPARPTPRCVCPCEQTTIGSAALLCSE
jgi:hypothetical protein